MADRLARMYGTEEDKVNCPFYAKTGACRHGDQCSRIHNKPLFSPTISLPHLYVNPMTAVLTGGGRLTREQEKEIQERFLDFYEDVFLELSAHGEIEEMLVCDNLVDHLVGNVYVRFASEEEAAEALSKVNGRWFAARQVIAEFSPVTEFRQARCTQFDDSGCSRGGLCNYMHPKAVPRDFVEELLRTQPHQSGGAKSGDRDRERRRSRSPRDRGGDRRFDDRRRDYGRRDDRRDYDRRDDRRDFERRDYGRRDDRRDYRDRDRDYDRDRDRYAPSGAGRPS